MTVVSPGRAAEGAKYSDPETGLLYLRARYYDPTTAQFLTRDPLDAMTRSAYGYGGNDPLNGSDPTGLSTCGKPKNPWDVVGSLVDCASKGDVKGAAKTAVDSQAMAASGGQANCVRYASCSSSTRSMGAIHPGLRDGLYIMLGTALLVASGGTLAAPEAGAFGLTAGGTQALVLLASGGAAYGDYGSCRSGDQAACAGFWLAIGGAAGGLGPLLLGESALGLTLGTTGLSGSMLGLIIDSIRALDKSAFESGCS